MNLPRVCPRCSRPVDDHTLRELREHHPAEDLNLTYESVPGGPISNQDPGRFASSVIAASIVADGGPLGPIPGVRFSFVDLDGLTPIGTYSLLLDDERLRAFAMLVHNAVQGSLRAAREARL